jgi:hypothetical protein
VRPSWRALPIVGAVVAVSSLARVFSGSPPPANPPAQDFFVSKVRPIFESRCRPCHFEGGKMYERLPFDRPETIRKLGSDRLFTRLKDEKDRAVVRAFLGEDPKK